MADLTTDVRYIKGIGEARARNLKKLGIETLGDRINYFPRAYADRREFTSIANAIPGETVCICAMVASEPKLSRIRKGLELVKVRVVDDSAAMDITFFNQSYLKNSLRPGESYVFCGKMEGTLLKKQMTNPLFEAEGKNHLTGRIVPIYPLKRGISQTQLSSAMEQGLAACLDLLPEILPQELRTHHGLCYVNFAYENIHFPQSPEALTIARRRMVFEELFLLSLGLSTLRSQRTGIPGYRCADVDMTPFYNALPFTLTGAQQRAVNEAVADMRSGRPMNRLCQGDVGSGKTMVAAGCIYFAVKNGLQSAMMAPTEILAEQHYHSLSRLMEPLGIRCALLTSSMPAKEKRLTREALAAGEIDLLIGTHALIGEGVDYARLGLVVTDEQHRFGVAQRAALSSKGENPHMLVMSATPIPRTLALIIYGDLDLSVIDELPPGRQKIDTFAVTTRYHQRIYAFLRKEIEAGHQAYIICPMVEENEELPDERKAVTEYSAMLQRDVFPDLRVAMVHGKMKAAEKEAVMQSFSAGESHILVSTTVVEVGVDVPNATVMVIENAERFGLSQLHQLRGRVGRGKAKSYCILISDHKGEESKARFKIMCDTNDGFKISEEDLRLRGPGDFFGERQHGLPSLRVADLGDDMLLLKESQAAAQALLALDPQLAEHMEIRDRVDALFRENAGTLN
ncbi:MAG: ATP-dependent DNA helicase RecG [Oscillospiraceae bacterium]|nr:ATP-dependent DNA helicase RecG [Oscillospiraceae bacterium]